MEPEFKTYSEEQLKQLIADIQAELAARDKQRKKMAAAEMKALADAAGLTVNVTDKPKKRRGRPPKTTNQQ